MKSRLIGLTVLLTWTTAARTGIADTAQPLLQSSGKRVHLYSDPTASPLQTTPAQGEGCDGTVAREMGDRLMKTIHRVSLPRSRGHPNSHESAIGGCHGKAEAEEAAIVLAGVQGGDGPVGAGEREEPRDNRPGARSHRDSAARMGAAG